MKKMIAFALCAILAAAPVIGNPGPAKAVEIPNPYVSCATLEEAVELAGFSISVPERISDDLDQRAIRAIGKEMIEVIYQNGGNGNEIRVRKAAGSGDISGDYCEYLVKAAVITGSRTVEMKGDGTLVKVAIWENDGYTYAVTSGNGVDQKEMSAVVQSVQ